MSHTRNRHTICYGFHVHSNGNWFTHYARVFKLEVICSDFDSDVFRRPRPTEQFNDINFFYQTGYPSSPSDPFPTPLPKESEFLLEKRGVRDGGGARQSWC